VNMNPNYQGVLWQYSSPFTPSWCLMIFTLGYLLLTSSLLVPNKTTFNLGCLSWMASFGNLCLNGIQMHLSCITLMLRLMPSNKILCTSYFKFIVATIICFYIMFFVYPCIFTLFSDGLLLLLMCSYIDCGHNSQQKQDNDLIVQV
jgi:hypothetical protein